ncbi:MAG TPA: cytochrome P450 [Niallia sp.]|nr:cytochrome P450 [Niallia sp.]
MDECKVIPKETGLDHSLSVLKEGYHFITNRCTGFQSDIFQTRLLGEEVICLRGSEGAKLFYDNSKMKRNGAAPSKMLKTLLGEKGVQTLDEAEHLHRKKMFMSLMTTDSLKEIRTITKNHWNQVVELWRNKKEITLYDEAKKVMCRTACEWAGVPLKEEEVEKRAKQLSNMIEGTASVGPKDVKARIARAQTEKWIEELIKEVRKGNREIEKEKTLYVFSNFRKLDGELLDSQIAAVEIINILRPIVAVSIYICFTVLAMEQHQEEVKKLKQTDEKTLERFVQEVRRFYPFFPFAVARTKEEFIWDEYVFPKEQLVLLDLYGTNHHPDLWENPEIFNPGRFNNWKGTPFNFIPQGGGNHDEGHRCAGEFITIEIMKETLLFFAKDISYTLPHQDVSFSFNQMPSIPNSGIILTNVEINNKTKRER